jgi:hypothetical protein
MSSRWQEGDHSNEDAATTFHCPGTEDRPRWWPITAMLGYRSADQNGGYLGGCAKTEVALRDELSLKLRPPPAEFTTADRPHAKGPGPAVPTALDPVRGTHERKLLHCLQADARFRGNVLSAG